MVIGIIYRKENMRTPKSQRNQKSVFETLCKTDKYGSEYWSAKELADLLGYPDYNHFLPILEKAKKACSNAGQKTDLHFKSFRTKNSDAVAAGNTDDFKLSRYGCYLAIINGDPDLKPVALGQSYFAVQTRLGELSRMHKNNNLKIVKQRRLFLREQLAKANLQLAGAARKAGILKPGDYALFQNHGYRGLYGGLDVKAIREMRNLGADENILDHMDSTELATNLFRVKQTAEKLNSVQVQNNVEANSIHFAVGLKVRKAIEDTGNALPETLPVMDSIVSADKSRKTISKNKK